MTIALGLLALVLPCLILAAWREDRRDTATAHAHERTAWQDERRQLLNRIKPETAQQGPETISEVLPQAPGFDDDDEYWRATESPEEMADRLFREELASREGAEA